ncbi:efflux RND transporter periplasmic adaptor subunit [Ramlibacter sp. 2FC]|uniref:efflux RND transporter periplasmic adaptor subunit n=1 Tax=Ramlibacter sp. 2FC TaxID=2502188 RepID=UPI0010FA035C|nr:efflux RND transporter periplasmic adaptor subunit [Ramlibacter sp. 2FC]
MNPLPNRRTRTVHRLRLALAWPLAILPLAGQAESFECLLEPNQVVEIRSAVEGLIRRIHVQRGDDVKAGQTLVELESAVERSSAAAAKYRTETEGRITASRNRMAYASKKSDRSRELHSQSFISAQARDEAETERNLAESELKEALENRELARLDYQRSIDLLNQKRLRSPFNGVVVDRMLNPGDLAESGNGRKPILKLAQVDPLRVEVVLPLATYGRLKPGMQAQVVPEGLGGAYAATVRIVDRVFDAASGTYGVRLELPNPKGRLPGGIRCRVDFPELDGLIHKVGQRR